MYPSGTPAGSADSRRRWRVTGGNTTMLTKAALLTATLSLLHATAASAETKCGSTSAGWNATRGAAVFARDADGIVTPVFDAVGEYRTHTMFSHGPGSWVSHVTMG